MRIAIVDDKAINRSTVKQKLMQETDIAICFEASNGAEFLKLLAQHELPDVVIMDLDMPIMGGLEAIVKAKQLFPALKFVVLTVFEDSNSIFEAIKAGANGYLLKEDEGLAIRNALDQVVEYNGVPMSPVIARKAMEVMLKGLPTTAGIEEETVLSKRELEILKAIASGANYNRVGEELFISPLTVRRHVANIYDKLHLTSKIQVIEMARKKGWI